MKIKNRRIDPAFMDWKTIFRKIWYNVYKKVGNNLLTPMHISFVICVWKSKRENINYIYLLQIRYKSLNKYMYNLLLFYTYF